MLMVRFLLSAIMAFTFLSCDFGNTEGSDLTDEAAVQWAEAYFNYQFERATRYVTPESRKWLRFAATNMSEQDVEVLRKQDGPAEVSLLDCMQTDDSTWTATIEVSRFMERDSLNTPGHMVTGDVEFEVQIVERNKRMFVKMEGLPRSGMRNRD